jgi:acyl carrier protein
MNDAEIESIVKAYVLKEFLPGEDPSALTDSVQLISTGILDSIAVLRLVTFLEEKFGIRVEAYETGMENLNTVADISRLVKSKLA